MESDRLEFDESSSTSSEAVILHEEIKPKIETPVIDGQHIFEFEIDKLDEKPWLKAGADITDYFNYGFDEGTWRIYCARQREIRDDYGTGFNNRRDNNERCKKDERIHKKVERSYKPDERSYKLDERNYKQDERNYKQDERSYKPDERNYRNDNYTKHRDERSTVNKRRSDDENMRKYEDERKSSKYDDYKKYDDNRKYDDNKKYDESKKGPYRR